ncbi:hypothetical protein IEQ34_011985 [Dendrobium chrysotoxum]|uniref:Uncharacterized protein n=1 Tax=Dendrobium chrysotoxum TaxID=161865 RepID=A0AAV7GT49_DENCH|nr:hypothetical protein IEQ34_011985 [Dendrobium chrysotoxum]
MDSDYIEPMPSPQGRTSFCECLVEAPAVSATVPHRLNALCSLFGFNQGELLTLKKHQLSVTFGYCICNSLELLRSLRNWFSDSLHGYNNFLMLSEIKLLAKGCIILIGLK